MTVTLVWGFLLGLGTAQPAVVSPRYGGDAEANSAKDWPRSGKIAFTRFPPVGNASIYTTTPSGTNLAPLLARTDAQLTEPSWSPDGRRVAFVAMSAANVGGIFVADAAGKHVGRLTRAESSPTNTVLDAHPRWSPDGKRIVFHRYRDAGSTIYVMNANGTGLRSLGRGFEPAWAPDGKKIVFADKTSGDTWHIAVMSAAGANRSQLTAGPASDNNPQWSPNGKLIVIQSTIADNVDIYVIRADGSGRRRLTTQPGADVDPAWSPDGERIVYASRRFGRFDLYLMNAVGTGKRRLNNLLGDEAQPSWQPLSGKAQPSG